MEMLQISKEKFEALKKVELDMTKLLQEKEIAQQDTIERDKFEKMKKDILEALKPATVKKIEFVNKLPDTKIDGITYSTEFKDFLYKVKEQDPSIAHLKTAMSTTDAQGGYTIPEDWAKEILNELNNIATAPAKTTSVEITGDIKHLNSLLTDLTVAWSTEATAKTGTKPTFSQDDLSLRFIYAIVTRTLELAQDSIIDIPGLLQKLVAQNFALEFEAQILQANANPFTGILNAVGVNAVAQAGANLAFSDLTAVTNDPNQLMIYKNGSEWWLTLGGLDIIMNLVDLNNRPLWNLNDPMNGKPSSICGYPYNISDQITDTTGVGGTTQFIFGNLKHVWQAKKKGQPDTINVLYSQTAVVGEENFFTDNKDGWRFELRRGFITAIPAAFDKLTGVK